MRDIAVAVALYNNEKEVIEFAKGLLRQSILDRIQLLVTCNACKNVDSFTNALQKVLPSALVFNPKKNLGYLNGCLYGVKESDSSYSWVMVSNTDIQFEGKDIFEKAIKNVSKDVWCIGPDIVLSATGVHQNPFLMQRPSKTKMKIWNTAYSNYLFFSLYFKLSELKKKKAVNELVQSGNVYAVHGSCFLLKSNCAEKVMDVSKGIFMYGEELLIAEVIRKCGKKCLFNSDIKVIHNENQVTGKIGNKRKQKWFRDSFKYLREHIN